MHVNVNNLPMNNHLTTTVSQKKTEITVDVINSVESIDRDFVIKNSIEIQRAAHAAAKVFLTDQLTSIGATVAFITPPPLTDLRELGSIKISQLLESVFYWEYTEGVALDIQRDGNRNENNIIIYGVASQFNGCEATRPYTIPPGQATKLYKNDPTQGPQAQLQFHPNQIELINCGGNIGFNGLSNILDEETKSSTKHGYFMPSIEQADAVIHSLSNKEGIEYLCVANRPYHENSNNYGVKPVHMILMSAPAFGYGGINSGKERDQIEFLCALQGFRAQFQHCIDLAKKENKAVIFKAAGMGLGVFGNHEMNVAKGFYVAAKEFELQLKDNHVEVRFQVFRGGGNAKKVANILKLTQWID